MKNKALISMPPEGTNPSLNKLITGYYCQKNTKPCQKCQYPNKFGVKTCEV
jgi:hypothetical protein